jgi:hypothetical protein
MVAYLVLSHTNIPQLARLVRRLAETPDTVVFVRHDGRRERLPADTFAPFDNVHVAISTYPIAWGRFSLLQNTLDGVAAALASGVPFDWMVLVSGQDYVCTDLGAFHRSLASAGVDGFIDFVTTSDPVLGAETADRYHFRYLPVPRPLQALNARLWRLNSMQPYLRFSHTRLGSFVGVADRKIFRRFPVRRGSFWWALSRPCLEELLRVRRTEHALVDGYRQRPFPEESFFQTVLLANPKFTFRNDDLHYIRWDDPGSGSPAILRTSDLRSILASRKPFARKFDTRVDAGVLDRLDEAVRPPVRLAR